MYNGIRGIINKNFQKSKVTHRNVSIDVSPSEGSLNTSSPVVVRGYDSLVIFGQFTGDSTEVEINVLPVDIDEATILSTPIATFTLNQSINNDNISIARGRPAVAIQAVNKDPSNTATVTAKVVATWR